MNSFKFYGSIILVMVITAFLPSVSTAQDIVSASSKNTKLINEGVVTAVTAPIVIAPVPANSIINPYHYGFTLFIGAISKTSFGHSSRKAEKQMKSKMITLGKEKVREERSGVDADAYFENDIFYGFSGFFIYKPTPYVAMYVDGGITVYSFCFSSKEKEDIILYGLSDEKSFDDGVKVYNKFLENYSKNVKNRNYRYKIIEANVSVNARWYPVWIPKFYILAGPTFIFNVYKKLHISDQSSKKNANVKKTNIALNFGFGCDLDVIFIELFCAYNMIDMFTESTNDMNFKGYNVFKMGGLRIGVDISKFI